MKKILLLFILICMASLAVFIVTRTRANGTGVVQSSQNSETGDSLLCVFYANTYLSMDMNGIVCANNSYKPEHIPIAEGVDFTRLTFGKRAQPVENRALEYVIKVAACLEKHGIEADKIIYHNRMITVCAGRLKIELGKNDKTDDKINDLDNFIDKLSGMSGTLYMQNANANNYGYTFRAD